MEKAKALLYTNMTPTKTPIPSKHPNLALLKVADLLVWGLGLKIANFAPLGLTEKPRPLL